jgi:FlaA1/EpsC-like NDP-sugar epimerase
VIVLFQIGLIASAAAFAWLLKFDFTFPQPKLFMQALTVLVVVRLVAMARFNLFHGYWRFTGINDAIDIAKAVFAGSVVFYIAERWIVGARSFPISIYFMEAILTGCALGGVRMLSRTFMHEVRLHAGDCDSKRVVVVGAGEGASMLLQELPKQGYRVCALVDDNPAKAGIRLHGVRVAGQVKDLPKIVRHYNPSELMIAIPSATRMQMQRIIELCQSTKLRFRTIPGLSDLVDGTVTVGQLRKVNLEDLLGRESIKLNPEAIRQRIAGRVVMVTGAAGSIGSELCRQLLRYLPAKLVFVDQAETPLFYVQQAHWNSLVETVYCVADITDSHQMRHLLQEHNVRVIFHAAAYKHVPLMEKNIQEAVKNNVFGLLSLMEVADQTGCEEFLLISSDKAVNPTSLMGCTKRIGELIVASRPSTRMRCVSVRFGNVLGSQGSVVPLFQHQLESSRRITVTDREVTRYFMTIPEAVSLVLQAFVIGDKGDILVLDMGKPVSILDMAKKLIRLSGIPEDEVEIVYTGLRPGEKLFEELFYDFEDRLSTCHEKVFRTHSQVPSWLDLQAELDALRSECATCDPVRIHSKVKEIVPQYQWPPSEHDSKNSAQILMESEFNSLEAAQTEVNAPGRFPEPATGLQAH